jgi:hypothetical protein
MGKSLLSIDWDYFIYTQKWNLGSYIENTRSIINLWYKRYIQSKIRGRDIQKSFRLSSEVNTFWEKVKEHFSFVNGIKAYVSDSNSLSYDIAREHKCSKVYLFDAHADLGYGGLSSLDFEVNCANWLGKLLKNKQIKQAIIIYSPYTSEKPECFKSINNAFNVKYASFDDLDKGIEASAVHICRSGAWTPPWLDEKFVQFVNALGIPYKTMDYTVRKWDTEDINLSDQIYYLMA